MPGFDRYFRTEPEAATHPKVRFWQKMQKEGARLVCELVRERDGLSFGPARLYVRFLDARGEDRQSPDEVEWDPRLNDALLGMGVQAATDDNEIKRFGLVLRDRLEDPEGRFGDGYYNAVLIEHIQDSPFAEDPRVREKLEDVTSYRASRDSRAYDECHEAIEAVLVRCARELMALYGDEARAARILVGALAEYLDERFSITNRQLLGWGRSQRRQGR